MNHPTLLRSLREVLGAEHVLCDGDLSAYELDWRRRFHGRALAVVRPADTAQGVAADRDEVGPFGIRGRRGDGRS